jgi:Arc/MetJ-type ribon-helix-helix transcriptional regulator
MPKQNVSPETEKITINVSVVDLGKIDLLVDDGFYSSRSDFIRASLRAELGRHDDHVRETTLRRRFAAGIQTLSRRDLERALAKNEKLEIRIVGMLVISKDVTVELALAALESVTVRGVLRGPADVKKALEGLLS